MALPSILGSIDMESSFIITGMLGTTPGLLFSYMDGTTLKYYWETNTQIIRDQQNGIVVISASGTPESIILKDTKNNRFLGFNSSNQLVPIIASSQPLKISQTTYATWNNNLFSAVTYSLYTSTLSTTTISIQRGRTGSTFVPGTNLVLTPVTWYFGCTQTTYNIINGPLPTAINWICLAAPSTTGCSGLQYAPNGWTNLPDCNVGVQYSYCPVASPVCGSTGNCNGVCEGIEYDCSYVGKNFTCVFNWEKFFKYTQWWTNPYVIALVIGLLFVILVIIGILFAIAKNM